MGGMDRILLQRGITLADNPPTRKHNSKKITVDMIAAQRHKISRVIQACLRSYKHPPPQRYNHYMAYCEKHALDPHNHGTLPSYQKKVLNARAMAELNDDAAQFPVSKYVFEKPVLPVLPVLGKVSTTQANSQTGLGECRTLVSFFVKQPKESQLSKFPVVSEKGVFAKALLKATDATKRAKLLECRSCHPDLHTTFSVPQATRFKRTFRDVYNVECIREGPPFNSRVKGSAGKCKLFGLVTSAGDKLRQDDLPYHENFCTKMHRGQFNARTRVACENLTPCYAKKSVDREFCGECEKSISTNLELLHAKAGEKAVSYKENRQRLLLSCSENGDGKCGVCGLNDGVDFDHYRPTRTIAYNAPGESSQSPTTCLPTPRSKSNLRTPDGWDITDCNSLCNGACEELNDLRTTVEKSAWCIPARLIASKHVDRAERHLKCRTKVVCISCHRGEWSAGGHSYTAAGSTGSTALGDKSVAKSVAKPAAKSAAKPVAKPMAKRKGTGQHLGGPVKLFKLFN